MHRTQIKICGITNVDDALAAVDCGVDLIGMILHAPGRPREIDVDRARSIAAALPKHVSPVVVVVDCPPARTLSIVHELRDCVVQLHGSEEVVEAMALHRVPCLKALRFSANAETELSKWQAVPWVTGILFDDSSGSGVESDWSALASIRKLPVFHPRDGWRFVASGGLHSGNVGRVVRELRPDIVDVSSGVESSIGKKSRELMREFREAVRRADAEINAAR